MINQYSFPGICAVAASFCVAASGRCFGVCKLSIDFGVVRPSPGKTETLRLIGRKIQNREISIESLGKVTNLTNKLNRSDLHSKLEDLARASALERARQSFHPKDKRLQEYRPPKNPKDALMGLTPCSLEDDYKSNLLRDLAELIEEFKCWKILFNDREEGFGAFLKKTFIGRDEIAIEVIEEQINVLEYFKAKIQERHDCLTIKHAFINTWRSFQYLHSLLHPKDPESFSRRLFFSFVHFFMFFLFIKDIKGMNSVCLFDFGIAFLRWLHVYFWFWLIALSPESMLFLKLLIGG